MEAVQNPGRHDVPINNLELGGKALLGAHAPHNKKAAWWQKKWRAVTGLANGATSSTQHAGTRGGVGAVGRSVQRVGGGENAEGKKKAHFFARFEENTLERSLRVSSHFSHQNQKRDERFDYSIYLHKERLPEGWDRASSELKLDSFWWWSTPATNYWWTQWHLHLLKSSD